MKTDVYTKILLTIIAACLVIQTVQKVGLAPEAQASSPKIVREEPKYGLVPVNANGSMDVRIVGVSTSDRLDVNIERVGGYSVYNGALPVKAK